MEIAVPRGRLKPENEKCIQENYTLILKEIDAKHIIDFLFERRVISLDDKIRIRKKKSKRGRTVSLIDRILHGGPGDAFQVFIDSLKPQYKHVSDVLQGYGQIRQNIKTGDSLKIDDLRASKVRSPSRINKFESIIISVHCDIKRLIFERDDAREKFLSSKNSYDIIRNEMVLFKEKFILLQNDLATVQEKYDKESKMIVSLQVDNSKLQEELDQHKKAISILQTDNSKLEEELDHEKNSSLRLHIDYSKLQEESVQERIMISILHDDKKKLQEKIVQENKNISLMHFNIKRLKESSDQDLKKILSLQFVNCRLQENMDQERNKNSSLEFENCKLQEELNIERNTLSSLNLNIKKLQEKKDQDKKMINTLQFDNSQLQEKLDQSLISNIRAKHELRWKDCKKYPGHTQFIPLAAFRMSDLPHTARDHHVFQLIKTIADLTVSLSVNRISPSRPKFWPHTNICFPMHGIIDGIKNIFGSGFVYKVSPYKLRRQCHKCGNSTCASKDRVEIKVVTAAHVVSDSIESRNTSITLFDNDDDRSSRVTVENFEVSECNLEEDFSVLSFVTCDVVLIEKLHRASQEFGQLTRIVYDRFGRSGESSIDKLVFIVSQPHGCSKQISIGDCLRKINLNHDGSKNKLTYTTSTCDGSAGALVYNVKTSLQGLYLHSGKHDSNVNCSTHNLILQ